MRCLSWTACLIACQDTPPATAAPTLDVPAGHQLAVELTVPCDVSCAVDVVIEPLGVTHRWPAPAPAHLPVLGLAPDTEHRIDIYVTRAGGPQAKHTLHHTTPPLPDDLPLLNLTIDPAADLDGLVVAALEQIDGPTWLVGWELPTGSVRLLWRPDTEVGDLRRLPNGSWIGLFGPATERDALLRVTRRWVRDPETETDIFFPYVPNHELYPLDDGFLTLVNDLTYVDEYPTSLLTLDDLAPATIVTPRVVRFDHDGTLRHEWQLSDVLDTRRVGFDSLNGTPTQADWAHGNAVVATPDGGAVVSLRHQDAVVRLDANGELQWILGTPSGWTAPWSDALLQPIGEVRWPYHMHAPHLGDDGVITLFDNQNEGRNPYEPRETFADSPTSRVVAYRVDDVARTVEQLWTFEPDPPVLSTALGDADPLPHGDWVLATFGFVLNDGPFTARGLRSVRLMVFDPYTGDVAFDLDASTPRGPQPLGVRAYRAEWVPTLMPPEVITTRSAAAPAR